LSGNGNNFISPITGNSSVATYAGPLVYAPPTAVNAYVSKSGQTAYFFTTSAANGTLQNVTNVNSSPTISVQFGGPGTPQPVQSQGPYWIPVFNSGAAPNSPPFVTYQLSCGPIQSVIVQNGGSGYASAPTVSITGGGGSGATATASLFGPVTLVTVTNGG